MKISLKESERSEADVKHDERLLKRIQTLVDVVYGLVLFQLFLLLPKPTKELIETNNLSKLITTDGPEILTVVIGIIWGIIYWGQSNTLFGYLKRTNRMLTALAIVQLFMLMLYLYFIKLDNETRGDVLALFSQSVCLALAGIVGVFFWKYAWLNNMLFDELEPTQRYSIYYQFWPEPFTAALTIPFAFVGVGWYTLSWLMVIPLGILFKRRATKKSASSDG